jgi:5-methylthioribose kinase
MVLKQADIGGVDTYLQTQGWLNAGEEVVEISIPGKGNMNYVIRIHTHQRTFILKQSMPWVEKYPQVAAPQDRLLVEHHFYKFISDYPALYSFMPGLIGFDANHFILCLQDAGDMQDATNVYSNSSYIEEAHIVTLVEYLNFLHSITPVTEPIFANEKMRQLNALHIFEFPLMLDNGFNLDNVQPGLQELAMVYKRDNHIKAKATELKQLYLADGTCLQHGDYYPGSWLIKGSSIKVIDPEFCFAGAINCFDLSVMLAHLKMVHCSDTLIKKATGQYKHTYDSRLLNAFMGIEIMRRLIGLAQLPLSLSVADKKRLLEEAREMMM